MEGENEGLLARGNREFWILQDNRGLKIIEFQRKYEKTNNFYSKMIKLVNFLLCFFNHY